MELVTPKVSSVEMGQNLSQKINEIENDETRATEAVRLRKIEGEMRQKYEEKKAKLYIEALNDECLPIVCAVDTFYEFLYGVKYTPADVPTPDPYGIKIITGKHLQGEYLTDFQDLVQGVVAKVLQQSTDHVEEKHTHVVSANRSVLRIDYYLYFHKSSSYGNVLFYFVQVGVIDMARARLPVLTYELTRATKPDELNGAGSKLEKMAESSEHLHKAVQILANAVKQSERGEAGRSGGPVNTSKNPGNPQV